ncbi:tRNA threonylcarbamoyladenosine biosynthesis protein TsaB [bacterium HR15]|nr:tRNA threonylcarbamoyladenosine biosynthesis protein TsaB [bacterium HR15]
METRTLLALESTGPISGVALIQGGALLGAIRLQHGLNLSGSLLHATSWLLQRSQLTLPQVDAFAVDLGPGSFTGLKIGVMLAKTWAHVLEKPLVGVSAFEACAALAPAGISLLVALPARRDALYLQFMPKVAQAESSPPAMVRQAHLSDWIEHTLGEARITHQLLVIGTAQAHEWLQPLLPDALFQRIETPDPVGVAWAGWQRFQAGEMVHPFSLTPLYIQPPSITPPKPSRG